MKKINGFASIWLEKIENRNLLKISLVLYVLLTIIFAFIVLIAPKFLALIIIMWLIVRLSGLFAVIIAVIIGALSIIQNITTAISRGSAPGGKE